MTYTITLIPGDGTGPEIAEATRRVLEATGVAIEWDVQDAGAGVMEREGTPLPERVLESIRRNKVAIKGPVTTPVGTGFRSVNVAMRKALNLYACVIRSSSAVGATWRMRQASALFLPRGRAGFGVVVAARFACIPR